MPHGPDGALATVADRFYCPDPPVDGLLILSGAEAHHLARVRRVGLGAVVEVFDGRGSAWRAEVRGLGKERVDLSVLGPAPRGRIAPCSLTLATALPKGDRVDWLVEKATELGVARLVPLLTARSVVDPRGGKLDRLRRYVVEAAKQCGRDRLMDLDSPVPWDQFLHQATPPIRLIAHPGGDPAPTWPRSGPDRAAALAVGPEGGFTAAEVDDARAAGWQPASLGGTLLRIETAGLAGCAVILALAGGTEP